MCTFESDPKYMQMVEKITKGIINARSSDPADQFAPMMIACDISAQVILIAYPREQWGEILDVFLRRLGNTMDRRYKQGTQ